MHTDGLKVVALIARKPDSRVEKTVSQGRATTIVSRLSPRNAHWRRKLLALGGDQQPRLVRHEIQAGLEKLRESSLFEYGPQTSWNFASDSIEILSPWLEGTTISDREPPAAQSNDVAPAAPAAATAPAAPAAPADGFALVPAGAATGFEPSFLLDDPRSLRDRLRVWVRFFERLAQWHALGVVHGNLSPSNLLVCDPLPAETTDRVGSEFFERKDNVPHVALLDGAYRHLLQAPLSKLPSPAPTPTGTRTSTPTGSTPGGPWHETFWLPPEASGLADGCYLEAGDIFALAAAMAWDLGFLSPRPTLRAGVAQAAGLPEDEPQGDAFARSAAEARHAHTVFEHLWPVFATGEARVFWYGGRFWQSSTRTPVVETLRKIRSLLARALHPSPDKRVKAAREVAFELMVMVTRLGEAAKEAKLDPQATPLTKSSRAEWGEFAQTAAKAVCKSLDAPDALLVPDASTARGPTRLWFVAKNSETNARASLRRTTAALAALEGKALYQRVRHDDGEFPFAALNRFVGAILRETLRYNPEALSNPHAFFKGFGGKVRLLLQVLPALRTHFGALGRGDEKKGEIALHARHEALHSAARKLVRVALEASRLRYVAIDDLHRADASSLEILLGVIHDPGVRCGFLLGTRSYEKHEIPAFQAAIERALERDPHVDVLIGPRQNTLSGRIAALRPEMARLMSGWTRLTAPFSFEDIEFLGTYASSVRGLLAPDFHHGKRSLPSVEGRDVGADGPGLQAHAAIAAHAANAEMAGRVPLVAHEAAASGASTASRDDALLAMDALRCARSLGLVAEWRDAASGRVLGFEWGSDRTSLTLSLLLTQSARRGLALLLSERHPDDHVSHNAWDTVLRMAELFADSDLGETAHAAFAAYVRTAESIPDLPSARFLAGRFTRLQERIERQGTPDADSLVPRIRETLADLSKALGDFETSARYYEAVGWNTFNPKRAAILRFKSFFPSRSPTRQKREEWFARTVREAVDAELLPAAETFEGLDPNLLAIHEMRKLEGLMEKESILGGTVSESFVPLRRLVKLTLKPGEAKAERLPYMPRSRSIREATYAAFLRSALGWVRADMVFPEAVRCLVLSVRAEDGESIVSALFSLYLAGGRQLRSDVRALVLELATDVATRVGDDIETSEAIALRAYGAFLFDGALDECRRCLDMLHASGRKELPSSTRRLAARLSFLCSLEEEALEIAKLPGLRTRELLRRLKDLGLGTWELGAALVDGRHVEQPLLEDAPGAGLMSDLLIEQLDQVLLYGYLALEHGNAGAAHAVCQRARKAGQREWLADGLSNLAHVPETVAKHWYALEARRGYRSSELDPLATGEFAVLEKSFVPSRSGEFVRERGGGGRIARAIAGLLAGDVAPKGAGDQAVERKQPEPEDSKPWGGKNWSQDLALETGLRYERAATPDPQRIAGLARAACQAGYLWLAYRLAQKAGLDLVEVVRDLEGQGVSPGRGRSRAPAHAPRGQHGRGDSTRAVPDSTFADAAAFAGAAGGKFGAGSGAGSGGPQEATATLALNFMLEFLHNMQRNVLESDAIDPNRVVDFARCLLKSVPVPTDATEAVVSDALRNAARRLGGMALAGLAERGRNEERNEPEEASPARPVDGRRDETWNGPRDGRWDEQRNTGTRHGPRDAAGGTTEGGGDGDGNPMRLAG